MCVHKSRVTRTRAIKYVEGNEVETQYYYVMMESLKERLRCAADGIEAV